MNNELFISQNKTIYPSLANFSIVNNKLILNLDKTYIIPLTHINLSTINSNIFLLNPIELFQSLYILELLYKNELNNSEITFINNYVKKYLNLNDLILTNQSDENIRVNSLGIPIYTAYNDYFINSPCANEIKNTINSHTEDIEKGGKGMRLVLSNPNFKGEFEEENSLPYIERAGFTTLFIIFGTSILTIIYIIFFIAK